jgi:hypothetical protein
VSLFGALLGAALSTPKWLPPASDNAADLTLIYAALGALAGFVGGFGAQFAPVSRRASH